MLLHEIGPRLDSMVHSVTPVGTEDTAELRQDGIVMAAQLLSRCVESGKKVTPGNIAFFTIKLLKAGRRSTGAKATDALGTLTQMRGRSQVVSTEQPLDAHDEESATLADILADDHDDPASEALRAMSWEELQEKLTFLEKTALFALAKGERLSHAALDNGVSPSTMSTARSALAGRIREEWGANAVAESSRPPTWNAGIRSVRETRASRYEHRLR